MLPEILIPVIGYFLGSIPFGYILVRVTEGKDIRTFGSGNIGATNVFRLNRTRGILTLLLDAGKGYLAVLAAMWLGGGPEWLAAAAVAAIVGHVFTVWLGFKGGKGVAAGCGAFLALSPSAMLGALALFVLVVALTRYVSAASIAAAVFYPFCLYLLGGPAPILLGSAFGALLIILKHHQNIRRILSGTESKLVLGSRS